MAKKRTDYDESSIKVLVGLEAVKLRPAMYIGSNENVDYVLAREAIENSVDEIANGGCDLIEIWFSENDSRLTVRDNGRGIPLGLVEQDDVTNPDGSRMSVIKSIFTILHSGGKFGGENSSYAKTGGLHGVGISVANALSSNMQVTVYRGGHCKTFSTIGSVSAYWDDKKQTYIVDKNYEAPLEKADAEFKDYHGTEISFQIDSDLPSLEGYGKTFNVDLILERVEELSFLAPRCRYVVYREDKEIANYYCDNELEHFNRVLKESTFTSLHEVPIHGNITVGDGDVMLAMAFTDASSRYKLKAFTNNIANTAGGTHVNGLMHGLHETFLDAKLVDPQNEKVELVFELEDIMKGIFGILHIKIDDAAYAGQVKERLVAKSAYELCREAAKKIISQFIEDFPEDAVKVARAAYIRYRTRKSSENISVLSQNIVLNDDAGTKDTLVQSGYVECRSKDASECEIFIVEGDSASGTLKSVRNKMTQAIQMLQGKIPNAAKKGFEVVGKHSELQSIASALGCGWLDICDESLSRFDKIIIATDADPDGMHIRAMLLTFFHYYMRPLLDAGKIYVVEPPLFGATNRIKWPGYTAFGNNLWQVVGKIEEISEQQAIDKYPTEDELNEALSSWHITRFKGLGEMSEEQTAEALVNVETRQLRQVMASDFESDEDFIQAAMGKDVALRKEMIGGVKLRTGIYHAIEL